MAKKKLVAEIKRGSNKAFENLFEELYEPLFHFAREYVIDIEVARNMVQDSFLVLLEKRKKLLDDSNLKSFLYKITRNNCINYLNRLKYEEKYRRSVAKDYNDLQINYYALKKLNFDQFDYLELKEIIEQAIEQLPPQCKTVFNLSRFRELKNKEIAEELKISIKTVETHMSKALRVLRVALKEYI